LPPRWRLHLALGRLYRAVGRRAAADGELAAARTVIEDLATGVPDEPAPSSGGRFLREHFCQSAAALLSEPDRFPLPRAGRRPTGSLTPREVEVLRLLAAGRSNREIAAALGVSLRTVEHHIASIYGKIGARRRADAATYALRRGLLPDGEPDR
jgi:DNA-binding CsgD family transcriptional regulator